MVFVFVFAPLPPRKGVECTLAPRVKYNQTTHDFEITDQEPDSAYLRSTVFGDNNEQAHRTPSASHRIGDVKRGAIAWHSDETRGMICIRDLARAPQQGEEAVITHARTGVRQLRPSAYDIQPHLQQREVFRASLDTACLASPTQASAMCSRAAWVLCAAFRALVSAAAWFKCCRPSAAPVA